MLDLALPPAHAVAPPVAWNPMDQQFIESDTTFLFDPDGDAAAGYAMGQPGSIGLGGLLFATDSSAPNFVAGRFRKGVNPTVLTQSFLWSPIDGLLPTTEFTLEFWLKYTADWSTLSNQNFIFCGINFQISAAHVTATLSHAHNPAVVGTYSFAASAAISNGQYPANTFVSCAVTLKAGVLTLYLGKQGDANITSVASNSGYVPCLVWGSTNRQGGIELIGGLSNKTNPAATMSDLRVSRVARVPAVIPTVSNVSTVTVGSTPTGATVQRLNGISKPVCGWQLVGSGTLSYPNPTAMATTKSQAGISVVREDKFLNTAPTIAGGTPDAAHPSVGHSGSFCYDWQVCDRTLDLIVNKMGCLLYITLDNNPQINGASVAPYSGVSLTTTGAQTPDVSGTINFSSSVASAPGSGFFTVSGNVYSYAARGTTSLSGVKLRSGTPSLLIPGASTVLIGPLYTGFTYNASGTPGPGTSVTTLGTLLKDLVYHVLVELGYGSSIVGWGLWNEPNGASEWTGTQAQYNTLYQLVMPFIKSLDSTQKVGGPEIASFTQFSASWIAPLFNFVATNSLPLDFVSFHDYAGDPSAPRAQQIAVGQLASSAGLATIPDIVLGEWGWQSAATGFNPTAGTYPWCQPNGQSKANNPAPSPQPGRVDFAINDHCAAYHAHGMIQQQNSGFVLSAHFTGNDLSLFDQNAVPQALYNVFRMWGMIIGKNVLPVTLAADPGIQAIAAQDGSHTYVLVSNLHYRLLNPRFPVTLDVSALGIADGTAVTAYLVDTTHSNAYDTLGATDVLTTVPVSSISSGHTSVTLSPRAVMLLVIG